MSQVSIASYLDPCAQFIAIQTKGRAKRRRPRTRRRDRLRNVSRGARCPPGALVACPPGAPAAFHCPSPRPYVPQVHKTWGHETPDARRRLTSPGGSCALRVSSTSRLSLPASAPGAPAARVAPCLSDEETGRKTNVNPSYRRGLRSAAVTNVNSRLTAGPRYGTSARAPLCGQALGKLAGVVAPAPRTEPFVSFLSQVCFDRACAMGTIGCDPWAASARSSVQKGSQTLPRRPVRRSRSWQHCNSEQL